MNKIKVGDKVKIIGKYSVNEGKEGIVVSVYEGSIKVFTAITDYSFSENELELVEVAHYVPVPKFHIGDFVYNTKTTNKYIILEERENDLCYHCWSYADDIDLFRLEEELTREVVTEETQDE